MEVRAGRADAAVGDDPALRDIIRKGFPELEVVSDIFTRENYGVVMRKGDPELLIAVNQALGQIHGGWSLCAHLCQMDGRADARQLSRRPGSVRNTGTPETERAGVRSALAINWPLLRSALPYLLRGAGWTLALTFLTLVIGIPLGLLIALARISHLPPLRAIAMVYIEVIRGTPLLMQNIRHLFRPAVAGHFAPAGGCRCPGVEHQRGRLYLRDLQGGIESIDTGQMEAARSLGMTTACRCAGSFCRRPLRGSCLRSPMKRWRC